MTSTRHTGNTCTVDEADAQTEAVKQIMQERGLNYGPAYDVYIAQQHNTKVDMSGWGAA